MKLRFVSLATLALAWLVPIAFAFDPGLNGTVNATLLQPDGRIVVGGLFTTAQGSGDALPVSRQHLARFNADGSLDTSFNVTLNGNVAALARQSDGSIIVGGSFTQAQVDGGTVYARSGLLRVTADGQIDTGFDPRPVGAAQSETEVSAIVIQSDGKIVIGGAFTSLQPNGSGSPVTRMHLARLLSDGSLDTSFSPAANNLVFALALQSDGRVLVGGGFTTLQGTGSDTATNVGRLVRLNQDGSLDTSFHPTLDNRVLALAVQSNGKILAGGQFITVRGNSDTSDLNRPLITRFNADGELDTDFSAAVPNANVWAVAIQYDGKILIGGDFSLVGNVTHQHLARLTQSGSLDSSFTPVVGAAVHSLVVQTDDKIILGGVFTRVASTGSASSVLRSHLARVLSSGVLDGGFGVDEEGAVQAAVVESSGSLLIGGSFRTIGGVTRLGLARLKTDGSLDANFHPEFDGIVHALVVQSDGKIVVGGVFTTVNGVTRNNLVRLNTDGSVDTSYDPEPDGGVYSLALRSNGNLLVGGAFTLFTPNSGTTTTTRIYLAELDSSGALTTFNPGAGGPIYALVRQADGGVLVGGSFSTLSGSSRKNFARLNSNNDIDANFNPSPDGAVQAIAIQGDGKILFGGNFKTLQLDDGQKDDDDGDGQTNDDADRLRIARINADGTLDLGFNPGFNSIVSSVLPTTDGHVFVGGGFTTLMSTSTNWNYLIRLNSDGTRDTAATVQTNDRVSGIIAGSDGSVYVYGQFTKAYDAAGTSINTAGHVIRLTSAGALDSSYGISTTNTSGDKVLALAQEADGRMLVGGQFSQLGGSVSTNLARLYSGGSPDSSFDVSTDGTVHALLVQPQTASSQVQVNLLAWFETNGALRSSFDRRDIANLTGTVNTVLVDGDYLLVGGSFTITGSDIHHLARFTKAGVLDTSFNPAPDDAVTSLALQSDGKIVVGGQFLNIDSTAKPYLVRLNSDGTLDTSFAPAPLNGSVSSVVIQSDGSVVVGGSFTAVEIDDGQGDDDDGDGQTNDDTGRRYLARFSSTGSLDTTYNPNANAYVSKLVLLSDGRIIASGSFTALVPNGSTTGVARNYLALLNTDGTVDGTFNPNPNGAVSALAVRSDGKIVIGGAFSTLTPNSSTTAILRSHLALLNADGTVDDTFNPGPDGIVSALALDGNGRIYLGGLFLNLVPDAGTTKHPHSRLARLNSDGSVDDTFNPAPNNQVLALTVAADGSIIAGGDFTDVLAESPLYVGGEFTTIGGRSLARLARLNDNGIPDSSFAPAPDGTVTSLAADASGRVLVGGAFSQIAGTSRSRLARFSIEGALDSGFAPSINGTVQALAVAPSGNILIGGDFDTVGGAGHQRVARLTASGSVDGSFNAQVDGTVYAVAAMADGRVLIGGNFSNVNGSARAYLARLNSDGTLDGSYNPSPNGPVYALSARTDGSVLAGGDFTTMGGQSAGHLAVLYSDGSVDASFTTTTNAAVWTAAGMLDGTAMVGGSFTSSNAGSQYLLTRLSASTAGTYTFGVGSGLNSATWTLAGGAPQLSSVALAYSLNGNSWTTLSNVSVSSDGKTWTWPGGSTLPANTPYLLRARAVIPTSQGGSSGVAEVMWQFLNNQPAAAVTINQGSGGSGGSSGGSSGGGSTTTPRTGVTGAFGSTTNGAAQGSFSDFSTLLRLHGGELQYVSFVINGSSSRRLFFRAAGPGLGSINVTDYAPSPHFEIYTSSGARWLEAAGPVTDSSLVTLAAQVGALPLSVGQADAAAVTTLAPGAYTLVVWDGSSTGGAVMMEMFEADGASPSGLVAYASRGSSASNNGVQATDFTITGSTNRNVLIRALGPALTAAGVSNAMADPQLLVMNSAGSTVASNDNWETAATGGTATAATAAQLTTAASDVGAVALAAGSKDAAVLVNLAPGTYTASVAGPASATGVTRVEVFEVPDHVDTSTNGSGSSTSSSSSGGSGGGAPSVPASLLLCGLLLYRFWRQRRK